MRKSIGQYDITPNITLSEEGMQNTGLKYDRPRFVDRNDFSDRPNMKSGNHKSKKDDHIFADDEIDMLFTKVSPHSKENTPDKIISHPFDYILFHLANTLPGYLVTIPYFLQSCRGI